MDYITFSRSFFSATGIPANLLLNGTPLYSSISEALELQPEQSWPSYPAERNPEFSSINPDLEYGHVHIEESGYDLYIGPIFTSPVSETLIREYFEETKTPPAYQEALSELLYNIPVSGHPQFIRVLSFLYFVLNHKEADISALYQEGDAQTMQRGQQAVKEAVDAKENERSLSSYSFERQLYHQIALGDTARLKAFLDSTKEFPAEGQVAHTPLRQAKNIFIGLASKAGILGALAGGLDEERVYQLINLYILECEQTQTIKEVHRLQYIFLMDLCQRVGEARLPKNISSEISQSMTYIQRHTNRPITIEQVAEHIHRSPSYLMKRFREETGQSVGAYITRCKMEEAEDLLIYSSQSLAEISAYLGYSSQSYFQNVFKKHFGMTPLQYRTQKSSIQH